MFKALESNVIIANVYIPHIPKMKNLREIGEKAIIKLLGDEFLDER